MREGEKVCEGRELYNENGPNHECLVVVHLLEIPHSLWRREGYVVEDMVLKRKNTRFGRSNLNDRNFRNA